MKHSEVIMKMAETNNGIVTASQVTAALIPRHYLSSLEKNRKLYKVDRGIYALPETWEDKMYLLQTRYSRGIFSHESALYLLDLTDRVPFQYTMTFPYGYHTKSLSEESIHVKKAVKGIYDLGIADALTIYNNSVRVYNAEKTLCDIVKGNFTDMQIVTDAMKKYVQLKNRNIPLLMEYARKIRVEKKIRNYMDVLL